MAITRVQTQALNAATGTSRSVTPSTAPTANNCQVLQIAVNSGTSSRVSSISQTNCSWTKQTESYNSNGIGMEVWTCIAGSSPGTSITINYAASVTNAVIYSEYSGVDTSNPVNATGTSIDSDAGTGGGTD
jgi:hypothetical protein